MTDEPTVLDEVESNEQPEVTFTPDDAKALRTLESVQKANFGRMEAAQKAIESCGAKISDLLNRKWTIADDPTYVQDDDYPGMVEFSRVNAQVAFNRRKAYVESWAPEHFGMWGYDPLTYLPSITLRVRHDDSNEVLVEVGEALLTWVQFVARHATDDLAVSIRSGSKTAPPVAEDENDRSLEFKMLDYDLSRLGVHLLRVFPDATAQRVETVSYSTLTIDAERRPLFDVLTDVRADWYYPAESNLNHDAEHPSLAEEFGWNFDADDADDEER